MMLCNGVYYQMHFWSELHSHNPDKVQEIWYLFLTVGLVASVFFYRSLLGGRRNRWYWAALVFCFLWGLNAALLSLRLVSLRINNLSEALLLLPVYGWVVGLLVRRSWKRVTDARLLMAPVMVLYGVLLYVQSAHALALFGLAWALHLPRHAHLGSMYVPYGDLALAFYLLAMLAILVNRFARTSREQDRVAAELEQARVLQHVLIPEVIPEIAGLRFEAAYLPAQEVGGDFFQILPGTDGATLVVLGDVAGKGLVAAMTVSLVVGAVRMMAEYGAGPAEVLAGLNRRLLGRGAGFTTCLVMRFIGEEVTLSSAGHLAPYLNRHEIALEAALPLGLVDGLVFAEQRLQLDRGDHLTVLTDGVPEAMCRRELFGFERTAELSGQGAGAIADQARAFGQTDDITVVTVDVS